MDAIKQAEKVSALVSNGRDRKYYRFRWAQYYGGIATADCVGCCLFCIFCWSWRIVTHPEKCGKFYTPEYVANQLVKIAKKRNTNLIRISGNEPTLNMEHLLGVLQAIPSKYRFVLETNGILLGHDKGYCKNLAQFSNLHIRVSLKGCNEKDFEELTGADGGNFDLQLQALENLTKAGVSCHPSVMTYFSNEKDIQELRLRLQDISPQFRHFEEEQLILYPNIKERLKKFKIIDDFSD